MFDMFDLFISLHPHILIPLGSYALASILASSYPYVQVYLLVSLHPYILIFSGPCLHPFLLLSYVNQMFKNKCSVRMSPFCCNFFINTLHHCSGSIGDFWESLHDELSWEKFKLSCHSVPSPLYLLHFSPRLWHEPKSYLIVAYTTSNLETILQFYLLFPNTGDNTFPKNSEKHSYSKSLFWIFL